MSEHITNNAKETVDIAMNLARTLKGGETIALTGNLGAGKTVFVKGLAKALGINDNITSPTFVLLKVYNIKQRQIKRFVHVDCYRLEGKEDLYEIGLGDYLSNPENVVVIEWADRISNLPSNTIHIKMEYISDQERRLVM